MKAISIAEVLALPVADRLKVLETIWDCIAEAPEALTLTPAQKQNWTGGLRLPQGSSEL